MTLFDSINNIQRASERASEQERNRKWTGYFSLAASSDSFIRTKLNFLIFGVQNDLAGAYYIQDWARNTRQVKAARADIFFTENNKCVSVEACHMPFHSLSLSAHEFINFIALNDFRCAQMIEELFSKKNSLSFVPKPWYWKVKRKPNRRFSSAS